MAEPFAGRWELEEQIHAGAMARVYRARDARTGERVAVKVPVRDDEVELQRFRQEAELLAGRHVQETQGQESVPLVAVA